MSLQSQTKRVGTVIAIFVLAFSCVCVARAWSRPPSPAEPWSDAQIVQPADFAKELEVSSSAPASAKPTVVYVGFRPLYNGAHIPGALFHGAAGKPEGLADLKAFAASLPRDTHLVIYCGCCPLEKCPNIRVAFTALHEMGFTHLRVLLLPTDFNTDWISKGFPVEKSGAE